MNLLQNTFMKVYKNRLYPNAWDLFALVIVLACIIILAWNARQMTVPYHIGEVLPISLSPRYLPKYAVRTVMRMGIAMLMSLLFTFTFGTWAAKSKKAERIIIPTIDILQSVPILAFLSITIVGFIKLFPNSMLGPECASIFVIFTSQAWNMALGFYQTLRTIPNNLIEASAVFQLSPWQKFWKLEVPFSTPGLLWNMMMSMSAGWFFVVASEAISVSNQNILLPGIGSYIAVAIKDSNIHAISYAIMTMLVVILIYDQLLFRPLITWAEKFKAEETAYEDQPNSWFVNTLQRTRLLKQLCEFIIKHINYFVNLPFLQAQPEVSTKDKETSSFALILNCLSWFLIILLPCLAVIFLGYEATVNFHLKEVLHVFNLGVITGIRVLVLILLCSLIWVPVGVWVGSKPSVARIAQPIAQFLAAFPANLLFPIVVIVILKYHLNIEIWSSPLMILGTQWYILFNVIAGASSLPKDLYLATNNLGVHGLLRWQRFILPGIFPYYITGAITAAGGAWNASIVAEVISWGPHTLTATGLGAYITQYATAGNFTKLSLGIAMMCLFILILNRLIWRPLYVMAEQRFRID